MIFALRTQPRPPRQRVRTPGCGRWRPGRAARVFPGRRSGGLGQHCPGAVCPESVGSVREDCPPPRPPPTFGRHRVAVIHGRFRPNSVGCEFGTLNKMLRPSEVRRTEAAGALGAWGRRPVSGGAAGGDPSPPRKLPARRRRLGGNAQPRGSRLSGCGVREDPVCGPGLSDAHAGPRAGTVCGTCTATSPAVSGSFSRRSARRACAPATAQRPRCGRRGSLTRARGWTGSAALPHEGETSCSKGRVRLWRTAAPPPAPQSRLCARHRGSNPAALGARGPPAAAGPARAHRSPLRRSI